MLNGGMGAKLHMSRRVRHNRYSGELRAVSGGFEMHRGQRLTQLMAGVLGALSVAVITGRRTQPIAHAVVVIAKQPVGRVTHGQAKETPIFPQRGQRREE